MKNLPVLDFTPLRTGQGSVEALASAISKACREVGFFYIEGHGISEALQAELEEESRRFFALPLEDKRRIGMEKGGRAWRGFFPVGDELTSGKPDIKEGIYFGKELASDDEAVRAGLPMHGPNLFLPEMPAFRHVVLAYIDALTEIGHLVMRGIARSLGLEESFFQTTLTRDPLILFRIFHYPPLSEAEALGSWGVGEHTDYGLLTLLKQDNSGGLEVKTSSGWIEAPPIPGTFVCNLGDMLDRMTGGLYRSTPHRVRVQTQKGRLSFPFFFDPSFHATIQPLPRNAHPISDDKDTRWDKASVHAFEGTYGDYILRKVAKVFPQLQSVLPGKQP